MRMKRWIAGFAALFCLLSFSGTYAESSIGINIVLQLSESAVLIGADGTELVPPGRYLSIESISPEGTPPSSELFSATLIGDRDCLLMDATGTPLSDAIYQYLLEENGHITFRQGGKYGVMDRALNVVIQPEYTQLVSNGEGGYVALTASLLDDSATGLYYLEPGAPETPTGVRIIYDLNDFSEGCMPLIAAENKKTGYINGKGEWVVFPQYSYAGPYKDGCAVANLESGVGIIDESGNWLLTPKYRAIYRSLNRGNLILGLRNRTTIHLIDPKTYNITRAFSGDAIFCGVFYSDDLAVIYDDDSARLIDASGEVLMDFDADAGFDALTGDEDRVIVRINSSDGETFSWLYSLNGTPLFGPAQALWFLDHSDDVGLYAYAKFDVETETEPEVNWQGTFEVDGTREVGIVNENGEILLPAKKYRDIAFLTDGYFVARTDDEIFIIDEKGNEIIKYNLEF